MSDDELPFNVTELDTGEQPAPPPVNLLVIECATCHEVLVNLLTRWSHRRLAHHYDHEPVPVTRTETK